MCLIVGSQLPNQLQSQIKCEAAASSGETVSGAKYLVIYQKVRHQSITDIICSVILNVLVFIYVSD